LDKGTWLRAYEATGRRGTTADMWDDLAICDERILPNIMTPKGDLIVPLTKRYEDLYGGSICLRKGFLTNCFQFAAPLKYVEERLESKSSLLQELKSYAPKTLWEKEELNEKKMPAFMKAMNELNKIFKKELREDMADPNFLTRTPEVLTKLGFQYEKVIANADTVRRAVGGMAIHYADVDRQDKTQKMSVASLLKSYDPPGQTWFFMKYLESNSMSLDSRLRDNPCLSSDNIFED